MPGGVDILETALRNSTLSEPSFGRSKTVESGSVNIMMELGDVDPISISDSEGVSEDSDSELDHEPSILDSVKKPTSHVNPTADQHTTTATTSESNGSDVKEESTLILPHNIFYQYLVSRGCPSNELETIRRHFRQ